MLVQYNIIYIIFICFYHSPISLISRHNYNFKMNHRNNIKTSFASQNSRGLKDEAKLIEISTKMEKHCIFAAALQESWRTGIEEFSVRSCKFLFSGPDEQSSNRGSMGVGFALSSNAIEAWNLAANEIHNDLGPRITAIRLLINLPNQQQQGIFFISAYSPLSDAPIQE